MTGGTSTSSKIIGLMYLVTRKALSPQFAELVMLRESNGPI